MAKKTVATLQSSSKRLTKAIKMVRSPKTGAVLGSRSFIFWANTTCAIITFMLSSVLFSCFVIMSSEMST